VPGFILDVRIQIDGFFPLHKNVLQKKRKERYWLRF